MAVMKSPQKFLLFSLEAVEKTQTRGPVPKVNKLGSVLTAVGNIQSPNALSFSDSVASLGGNVVLDLLFSLRGRCIFRDFHLDSSNLLDSSDPQTQRPLQTSASYPEYLFQ